MDNIKPNKKVLEIVRQFESKNVSDMSAKVVDVKESKIDAFEALMNARERGDTQIKTPVRKQRVYHHTDVQRLCYAPFPCQKRIISTGINEPCSNSY